MKSEEQGQMKSFRPSSAPLAWICPAAAHGRETDIRVRWVSAKGGGGPAGVGSALHSIAAKFLQDGFKMPDIEPFLVQWDVEEDRNDVEMLSVFMEQFWSTWGAVLTKGECHIEERLKYVYEGEDPPFVTEGTPDIVSLDFKGGDVPLLAYVVDWKTTRLDDTDYGPQLLWYCCLLMHKYPTLEEFQTVIPYLRDRTMRSKKHTRLEIEGFEREFIERVVRWNGVDYTAGGHCRFCPRFMGCEAHTRLIRKTLEALGGWEDVIEAAGEDPSLVRSDPVIVDLYRNCQVVTKLLDVFKGYAKLACGHADNEDGRLVGEDGFDLLLKPNARDEVLPREAWPILSDDWSFSKDDMVEIVSMSKGKITDIVGARADKGEKGRMKKAVVNSLREGGALERLEFEPKLVVTKSL